MKRLLQLLCFAFLLLAVTAHADSLTAPADSAAAAAAAAVDTTRAADSITGNAGILEKNGQPLYPLSPERKALLSRYANFTNLWRFVDLFVGLLVIALILFTGFSAKLRDWAKLARLRFFVVWLYTAMMLVTVYVITFPFTFYREYVVENQYGFMNQTFWGWLGDSLLMLLVTVIIAIIPAYLFYFIVARFKRWWLGFSLAAVPFLVLFMVIAPIFIMPLFNKFEPLKDKQLEQQILTLADKAGIEGSRVFQVNASKQSAKVNAYVTGMFGTKRIVLYDTLIKGFTPDEVKFVMGHEMGHYVMHHIWYGLAVALLITFLMLWLTDKTIHAVIRRYHQKFKFDRLADIASLPLVLAFASVIGFIIQPINNGLSRYFEHQSDKFSMNVSGVSGDEAAIAFDKLSAYNLSDPNPSGLVEFWFYDHPALGKRMEFVRQYKAGS